MFGKIDIKAEIEYLNTKLREFGVYAHRSIISTTPRLSLRPNISGVIIEEITYFVSLIFFTPIIILL
jgi:hypothetical protein